MTALAVIAVVAALTVAGVGALWYFGSSAVKRNATKKQEIVPGVKSAAPLGWVGAHTPEAKLHRRLRDAVAGLRAVADANVAANVNVLEQEALKVEGQLVAAAGLADRIKPPALEQLEVAVTQIENVAGRLIHRSAELSSGDVQAQLAELSTRLELLDQARAELEDPQPGTA